MKKLLKSINFNESPDGLSRQHYVKEVVLNDSLPEISIKDSTFVHDPSQI
jgi:hypothetical protein